MRKSSLLSLAAALLLTVSLLPLPAQAAETQLLPAVREAPAFSDTTGTEYADATALVYEAGLMDGYTASAFGPEDPLMPQQLVAVCARLHSRLTGGTLSTVARALEQDRDVFAVPHAIDAPMGEGTNRLIQQGAKLVTCGRDILEEYSGEDRDFLRGQIYGTDTYTYDAHSKFL